MSSLVIRDARPSDAPFLAECILTGMHLYDFEEIVNDDLADALENITQSEGREDTLYTYSRTRIAEVDGKPAGALLSYPGEYYLDSLAVHPDFRRLGIGRALLEDGIKIYQSIGFVPADHRNVFGTDFLRMIYTV